MSCRCTSPTSRGCHISYCGGGGIVCRGGDVRNIHVGTCDLESNHAEKGPPTANVLIDNTTSANGTAEVAITGCTIQHNSKSPDSANIRILGRGNRGGAGQAQWGHVTITGNVFSDVMTNVHLNGCRGVTLTGNTFWMGYKHNLLVEDCRQIVVGANALERNPAYAYGNSQMTNNAVHLPRLLRLHAQRPAHRRDAHRRGRPRAGELQPLQHHRLHDSRLRQRRPLGHAT